MSFPVVYFDQLGKSGRLGNQIIQIMATVGIADRKGAVPRFNGWPYAPFFNIDPMMFGRMAERDRSWNAATNSPLARRALPDRRARPYLQSLRLFDHLRDQFREWFSLSDLGRRTLADHLERTDQNHLPDLLGRPDTVALHVRRGDNADPVTHPPGTWPMPTLDYYREALNRFDPHRTAPVVVFSDDIAWCQEHLPFDVAHFVHDGPQRPPEYRDGTDGHGPSRYSQSPALDWVDCHLMSLAPRLITANSSYSWLAGYLGGGQVVVPDHWTGYKLPWVSWRDLIPADWSILPNPVGSEHLHEPEKVKR